MAPYFDDGYVDSGYVEAIELSAFIVGKAYPTICYDNRFADAVPVASTTALGAAVNLADFRPYRQWKPSSLPATVTVDCGSEKTANSLALFSHDLGSKGATIEVRGSTDNFSSSDVLLASKAPSDDKPFVLFFASASYRYWRVRITGSTAPTLSLCVLGNALQFPCGVAYGFAQLGRQAVKQSNISETGQPLGSATLFDKWARTLNFPAIANGWLRDTFLPAWQAQLRDGPFLFAHNLSGYQNDIYLVTSGGKFDDVPASIGKSSLVFDVEGAAL